MAPFPNPDHILRALVLIRSAQRAIDTALRLPAEDRDAVAEQVEAVRHSSGQVATALAATIPGARSLAEAGQGLAMRPELRAAGGIISFFADQGSQAFGAVAGAAASLGGERDQSLALSEQISQRLATVGVATRQELARELDVDARSTEFRDALERTLGTGHAEWYGSGTYGLPRAQLETMIARGGDAAERGESAQAGDAGTGDVEAQPDGEHGLGQAVADLRASVDDLRNAISGRAAPPGDLP